MPAFLKSDTERDILTVTLSKLKGPEFSDTLARVKSVPGRRFDPDTKEWQFPRDADTALRLMQMLEPVADAETQAMVREHTAEVAASLVTKLPDDAELEWSAGAAVMRPYQRSAVNWFQSHPHSILADEMGTGKTLQALATVAEARARYASGSGGPLSEGEDKLPVLIVCPNSLKGTWHDEIHRWIGYGGGENTVVIDGKNPTTRRKQAMDEGANFLIVNWEKLRLMPELAKREYAAVIADEAHRAKNRKAQQTKALWRLRAPIQLALTGTPVMNSPDELWSILRWLRPEQYTGYWPFYYSYVEEYATNYGHVVVGVKNPDQLRFELADKLVRRTKRDVLPDLPDKTHVTIDVDLAPEQRKLYEAAETELLLDIERVLASGDEAAARTLAAAVEAGDVERVTYLLPNGAARTTRLRQLASTPALLGGPEKSAKLDTAEELIRDNRGTPFVVFTWFAETARILARRLEKGKPALRVGTIAGGDDPDPIKDAFQAGDLDVVVCTIAKGGVGLTLTRASDAIFVERDWTPAINAQAEDRLHRIGQKDAVTIYNIRAKDTIDVSKIAPANRLKTLIANQVLGDQHTDD